MTKDIHIAPQSLPEAITRDRIRLTGLTFEGRHGWYEAERKRPRPFVVDLVVAFPLEVSARSDRLTHTLDYDRLAETVLELGRTTSFKLIERLAGAIADALLEGFPIEAVEVTVHKPAPAVAGSPTAASVTLYRSGPVDSRGGSD